jgi:hypothetical protein
MSKKRKLRGTVQKVLKSPHSRDPEKAEISIDEAEDLYKEIRIENVLKDEKGEEFHLKPGAKLVVLEADSNATLKNPE